MKSIPAILFPSIVLFLYACSSGEKPSAIPEVPAPIVGTWKLISGTTIEKGDTSFTDYTLNQDAIKIINASHFSFFRHDLVKGKDSAAVFVSGGGRYTLNGTNYQEHLQFCNFREWEDLKFDFRVSVVEDTLIQRGIEKNETLGVDRIIEEKYIKIN